MSKTTGTGLFAAIAAALILAGVAGWPVSDTQARAPETVQIDPFTMMTSAKQLPIEHFADYSFMFNWAKPTSPFLVLPS
jgi:hypothetical protein